MSEEEIKENKLFDYPEIKNNDQNPILGFNATDTDIDAVRYLNGYRGPKNQIHVFILCFNNPSLEIAEMQKAYWQGGNKNEFVAIQSNHIKIDPTAFLQCSNISRLYLANNNPNVVISSFGDSVAIKIISPISDYDRIKSSASTSAEDLYKTHATNLKYMALFYK